MSEVINTEIIDSMASNLREVTQYSSTESFEAAPTMMGLLEMEARVTIWGGVVIDPLIAVGLDKPNQVSPSCTFSDGEAAFTGRFKAIELVDFTSALQRARDNTVLENLLPPNKKLITHGLVFETDDSLERVFGGNIGVASLLPYVAILPGTLYRITRLTL